MLESKFVDKKMTNLHLTNLKAVFKAILFSTPIVASFFDDDFSYNSVILTITTIIIIITL